MTYRLEVKSSAREEIAEIFLYYEMLSPDLGMRFLDAWERSAIAIQKNPLGYALKKRNFRQAMMKKFPYLVVFELLENAVVIYAIIHAKKRPGKRYRKK